MNKIYLTLIMLITSVIMNAQSVADSTYYYYNNKKVYLPIDKSRINVITSNSESLNKLSILNLGFEDFVFENVGTFSQPRKLAKIEPLTPLTSVQFNQKISSLKQIPEVLNIGLYFQIGADAEPVGTSNIFYVKLKSASDIGVLEQFAAQKGVYIERQIPNMPKWYVISVNNVALGTALNMANIFYESGLFADVDPAFIFDFFPIADTNNTTTSATTLSVIQEESGTAPPPPSSANLCPITFYPLNAGSLYWLGKYTYTPSISISFHPFALDACGAWEITEGEGVKIAIIDQGVQLDHVDLADNISSDSYDCLTGTSPSIVWGEHGTMVAGMVGALKGNSYPNVGIAPQAEIMSVSHTLDASTPDISAQLADGISWAWQNGAEVINNSWGATTENTTAYNNLHSSVLEDAIMDAMTLGRDGKGSVVVFASGNVMGRTGVAYPANFHPDILVVGAIGPFGNLAQFPGGIITYPDEPGAVYELWHSAYGPELDVVANGGEPMRTTGIDNQSVVMDHYVATSMSAGLVSGLAGLVLSVNPCLTREEVCNIIERTTRKISTNNFLNMYPNLPPPLNNPELYTYPFGTVSGRPNGAWNGKLGYGLVEANAAVQMALEMHSLDLMIRDSEEDTGTEPNTVSASVLASPDIWIRNQPDGIQEHQNPKYQGTPNYVYVRVTNKSCVPSSGTDSLTVYYSRLNTFSLWDVALNTVVNFNPINSNPNYGSEIGTLAIPALQPGEEAIIGFPWVAPNPDATFSSLLTSWNYNLLARISSDDDPMTFEEISRINTNVRRNNNIAQRNVTVISLFSGSNPIRNTNSAAAFGNPTNQTKTYHLNLTAGDNETGRKIFEEAEVRITLDETLLNAWLAGGKQGNNVALRGLNTLMVLGDNASLNNLIFGANKIGLFDIEFNFLTKEVTEKQLYVYNVTQIDASGNDITGGVVYEIRKSPRDLFYADAGGDKEVDKNETVVLSAEPINESAVYNWYDEEGNLIYEGADFTVSVEIGKKYKLEVISLADGYKDYTEVEVKLKPNSITSLYPNPTSNIATVAYKINKGEFAYMSVNSLYGSNTVSYNYVLDITKNEVTVDASTYPQGFYSIALIVNGQIQDTTTLIKQ